MFLQRFRLFRVCCPNVGDLQDNRPELVLVLNECMYMFTRKCGFYSLPFLDLSWMNEERANTPLCPPRSSTPSKLV